MELFKGRRYWPTVTKTIRYGPASGHIQADHVVIGGGMSGMLAAYHLAQAGYSVVLLEQKRIAQGSTSLNTGLIQYMSDMTLCEFTQAFSRDIAVSFYRASRSALDRIEAAASGLGEEVAFRRNHSLFAAGDPQGAEAIRQETTAQQAAGFDPEYFTGEEALERFGIKAAGVMLTKADIELNPMAFVVALAEQAARDYGLRIVEGIRVEERDIDFSLKRIQSGELTVTYDRLIVATGYDFFDFAKRVMPGAKLIATYAAVTKPLPVLPAKGHMYWERSRPYGYFRKSPDNQLIIGGRDKDNPELARASARIMAKALCEDVSRVLKENFELVPDYYYAAVFGESRDGLPYIGPHPDLDGVFLIHGIGGNGTVYSAIAAGEVLKWTREEPGTLTYLWPGQRRILEGF